MSRAIPTNIISGFLGVGKTTLIRRLLETKPETERWAVLVNEFGEVGIDGALMQADGIAVKEVPGGCMCCSVGLPSRAALNQLIEEQNPDRILIEPTGLAHPVQVIDMFSTPEYAGILDVRATIGLVDPWCLTSEQFRQIPAFDDQLRMADVLVATKIDTAEPAHLEAFFAYAETLQPEKSKVGAISEGEMPWQWLDYPRINAQVAVQENSGHGHHHSDESDKQFEEREDGLQRLQSQTEYAHSCGWIFPAGQKFDLDALVAVVESLNVPRIKGIFETTSGWFTVNKMRVTTSKEKLEEAPEEPGSRVEMIHTEAVDWDAAEQQLRTCLVS
jgi:G3E family GTPase